MVFLDRFIYVQSSKPVQSDVYGKRSKAPSALDKDKTYQANVLSSSEAEGWISTSGCGATSW